MKKFIYCATALVAALFAASCQREMHEPVAEGGVTYTITLPETVQTRGESGYAEYDLYYEVYKTIDATKLQTATKLFGDQVTMTTNPFDITLDLLNDQDYTILFWANKKGVTDTYFNLTDLRNVQLNTGSLNANDNDRDAFCGMDQIDNHDGSVSKTVKLTRPFAQVNIGTIVPTVAEIGYDVTPQESYVKISGVPVAYNVLQGKAVAGTSDVEFKQSAIPADKKIGTDYTLVAMNYVLVPESNITVEYRIKTPNGNVNNIVSNVPVKKNYRTNIIGNLLTSNADYTVEIKPGFETDGKEDTEVINEGVIKNINGDYEVSNAAGLAYAMKNLFVDANGVANTATFYIYPGTYDLTDYNVTYPTVSSGTLRVIKGKPVVTRTAGADDVIILGLKDAFIKAVSEDATVIISGITVKDFEGTGAALVAENNGKVVLSDCKIINEDGTPDVDTPLVGGNAPDNIEGDNDDNTGLVYTAAELAAAFADETVEAVGLGKDIAVDSTLTLLAGRNLTLDLRGLNLTIADPEKVASIYAINNLGNLTIKDRYGVGSVTARGIYNGYDAEGNHSSTAKLTVESGIFNAMGTNGGAAVYNYGVADINGGKFESNGGYGLNNQGTGEMTIDNADVRGGVYNVGTLTVDDSKVYQHLSGKHCIYNWEGSVTINGGEFDSESGNELILADGENASVTINDGTFHKTAKSWLYGAATGKNITFTINGGTHYGYVNQPEMTVDTFRPYGDPIVVKGGSYNFDVTNWCHEDYKSVKNYETSMWDIVAKVYVAKIGEDGYESLQEAFNAVKTDNTITILKDLTDVACYYNGTASFTLDLNGKTLTSSDHTHMFEFNWNQVAESTPVTINITNGTLISGENTMWTIYSEDTNNVKGTFNLTNLTIDHNMPNYGAVVAGIGNTFNAENVNITTSYGIGFYAAGGEVVMNDCSAAVEGLHVKPYNSMAFAVVGNGKMTIESGIYSATPVAESDANNQGTSHGSWCGGIMNSGGTLIINGGTFSNDNFGENSLATYARGLLLADTGANIQINGGTFNAVKAIVDVTNNLGDASRNPSVTLAGGNFSADPRVSGLYGSDLISVAEGKVVLPPKEGEVYYTIGDPVVKVGNTEYGSIDEAIAAWTNNTTLTLLADVKLSDVVKIKSTEHHTLDLGTYTMTAADKQNAIEITCEGQTKETYALTVNADATTPGGILATGKACIYYKKSGTTQDRPMICINNGVFTGSYSINVYSSNRGTNCPTVLINNGIFNSYMSVAHGKLRIYGGTFHGSINCTGDSTAYRHINGGRFKSWQFMTGDANNKFWVGSAKDTYDVGVYVDDEGYLVVGGPVITEFDDRFEAKAKIAAWSSYLKYSSAANGLYYTKKDNIKKSDNILELNPNKTFE